jgi:alginate O-acetyltransferase complex protein AlgI
MGAYFMLGSCGFKSIAILWVALASIVFYGWDDPLRLIPILLVSIFFNLIISRLISRGEYKKYILILGISLNLAYLFFFKYFNFVVSELVGTGMPNPGLKITLPIGISFYTFTQIAYLVDVYRKHAPPYSLSRYTFFVTYFPHLIAGPILHHGNIMPQLNHEVIYRVNAKNIALGLAWFAVGLFKKVVIADNLAAPANRVFSIPMTSAGINFIDAWTGALSYSLQIYFDFSGYSDMAIGLALMMGITFPLNFLSPYKATSLIEFWRRWNITLSHFLRDYLYFPLGGNRKGPLRRYINLIVTMVLGGLWHGASYNFILWGLMHGVGLAFNHAINNFVKFKSVVLKKLFLVIGYFGTLIFVIFAWVPFRADNLTYTLSIWKSMIGINFSPSNSSDVSISTWLPILIAGAIAIFLPNTAQVFGRDPSNKSSITWKPNLFWAFFTAVIFGIAVGLSFTQSTAFLYFQF